LIRANYKQNIVLFGRKKILIKPGQFIMGLKKAKEEIDLAVSTIHYWLSFLEDEGMVELKKTNKYTIITILNWKDYQQVELKKNSKDNANGTLKETNNKDNKEKNIVEATKESIIPLKEEIKEVAKFNAFEYIEKLRNAKQRHISIVGKYMRYKQMDKKLPTLKAAETEMKRHVRAASELADYSDQRIKIAWIRAMKITKEFTLTTVLKEINK
jgi:hypothetical protein